MIPPRKRFDFKTESDFLSTIFMDLFKEFFSL